MGKKLLSYLSVAEALTQFDPERTVKEFPIRQFDSADTR